MTFLKKLKIHNYVISGEEIPVDMGINEDSVAIPFPNIPMPDFVVKTLCERVNPMDRSSSYGIELYETAVEIANSLIDQ